MSDNTTIARPYAKAVFKLALDGNQLSAWSVRLENLAQATLNEDAIHFISNPATTLRQHSDLLLASSADSDPKSLTANLIHVLAANKRLLLLPDIYLQFERLRAEQEKTLTVYVSSFSALTPEQERQLVEKLSKRLQRQVTLDINLDKSLLGGAVIRAGDLVIDDSVIGKLIKLGTRLAA